MVARQRDFFSGMSDFKARVSYGGTLGGRKVMRPLDRRHPVLITMKSDVARGALSLLNSRHRLKIKAIIRRLAGRNGIRVHRLALLSNHIHLTISFLNRELLQSFLRAVSGLIARIVTGAKKGKSFGKFWSSILHSRVIRGGRRDYVNTDRYVQANQLEATYGRSMREFYLENPVRFAELFSEKLSRAEVFAGSG